MNDVCRLVCLAVTAPHPDASQDWKRLKRGDVADVVEDGVFLGLDIEYPSPEMTGRSVIIEMPGVPAREMSFLGGCQLQVPIDEPLGVQKPHNQRVNTLDLDALGFTGSIRAQRLAKEEVLAVRSVRQPWRDPTVIGEESGVVG